ncbi:MAG: class I SAM-dependent methyltransferase [Candidatus Sungbacteria bacterium]|uniref:Class I SAM-dependent methyltransferase n=1 Tax=Candidatus Sungiibacteriota bacterium TaxID=2750080 RepID=A0A932YY24_9BACT|nr:class I SAM-dependent methyltransferase [Candidatus Sungbacteria bacterium]MBI4132323.1 class I SAM-dependent methyltransferase [Candidatus Sungbacteria bacterium]
MAKNVETIPFSFGSNFRTLVKHYVDDEHIAEAEKALAEFLLLPHLRGKTFLDIGSGHGFASLAAFRLGAEKILSVDKDPASVECTQELWRLAGSPVSWQMRQGSVLDIEFVKSLGTFDIVHSWGVLHHTGAMWEAIQNAATRVRSGGLLHIAIYNKADVWGIYPDGRFGTSSFWRIEKKIYSSLPLFLQTIIDYVVAGILIVGYLLTLQNPIRKIREHKRYRGMVWFVDIKDWLGGYPYEAATVEEIFRFVKKLGFTLENLKTNNGLMNNEYLFRKF